LPTKRAITVGETIRRLAKLALDVDAGGSIYVGGQVFKLGVGSITL